MTKLKVTVTFTNENGLAGSCTREVEYFQEIYDEHLQESAENMVLGIQTNCEAMRLANEAAMAGEPNEVVLQTYQNAVNARLMEKGIHAEEHELRGIATAATAATTGSLERRVSRRKRTQVV